MSYQANQPGTELTLDEQTALSQLANLGSPNQILSVNSLGTGLIYINIPNAVWGSITGTISNQNDLQTELNLKLLKAGDTMTGNLNMHADIILKSGQKIILDG